MSPALLFCCFVEPRLVDTIEAAARAYDVPVNVLHSVITVESGYRPRAINKTARIRSYGLTQLTIDTAWHHCGLPKAKIMDPRSNIFCGAKVLSYQLRRYRGNIDKALSAYNAGTFTRTNRNYVRKVRSAALARN